MSWLAYGRGPRKYRASCLCLGACALLLYVILQQTQKWLLPSPTEKLVSGASFTDSYGTFLLNLRKAFVFRLLRALTPRPCFRVLEWPQLLPPVLEVQEHVYLIECLVWGVTVKSFWRKQFIAKDDTKTYLWILHPLSTRVSFSALSKSFQLYCIWL